jgi:hypothetical protein
MRVGELRLYQLTNTKESHRKRNPEKLSLVSQPHPLHEKASLASRIVLGQLLNQ